MLRTMNSNFGTRMSRKARIKHELDYNPTLDVPRGRLRKSIVHLPEHLETLFDGVRQQTDIDM